MTPIPLSRLPWWLALAAAAACAASPGLPRAVVVEPGRRTTVKLIQASTGQTFVLQNASSGSAKEVYSDPQTDPLCKVVSDAQLQALLDVFAEQGLFQTGVATVPPDARDIMVVEHAGRRWSWARRKAGVQADEAAVHEAKAYFLEVYNGATAFHAADVGRGDLFAEREKARQDADAAKRKLEGLQGRPK